MNYHTQTCLAQLRKNGSIKVQFKAIQRRRTPLSTGLRSSDCWRLNEGDCWLGWKVARACEACWRTCALGKTFELTRSWFRRWEIVHINMAMRSIFFLFSWTTLIRSLVFEISYYLRSSKPGIATQISSNVAHSHNAWTAVSDSTPHCSHLSSNKIILLSKLCFAGIAFLANSYVHSWKLQYKFFFNCHERSKFFLESSLHTLSHFLNYIYIYIYKVKIEKKFN